MSPTFDAIALIEQGYAPQPNAGAWVQALAECVADAIDPDASEVCAYVHGPNGPEGVHTVRGFHGYSAADALNEMQQGFRNYPAGAQRAVHAAVVTPGLTSSVEVTGQPPGGPLVRDGGFADASAVVVRSPDSAPVVFSSLLHRPLRVDAPTRALWRQITTHLGAGLRLSGRGDSPEAADVECVLDPGGQVVEMRGGPEAERARERLRAAVRDIDRARSHRGRSDAHGALELWRGLFAGRWSLVDHFDSDGRRFVLARCNEPNARGPALPLRQRQVLFYASAGWSNKEIGYALGIGATTAGAHLHRAFAVLGVRSRSDWVGLAAESAAAAERLARGIS